MIGVLNSISRLSLCSVSGLRNVSTCTYPLCFRVTDALLGEPLKRKKKLDPAIIRAREDRKKRRLEKLIRRMEKSAKQLKPIFEITVPPELIYEKEKRFREIAPLSAEELEERMALKKEWCRYKTAEWLKDLDTIKSVMASQENALKELRAASEELYQKAVELDDSFLPYDAVGPVHTPPIPNYPSPDGEYIDVTTKYEGET